MSKSKPRLASSNPARRYRIEYSFDGRRWKHPDATGSCETLKAAYGNAARHVARADLDASEYRAAIIVDRWTGKLVRRYSRASTGINIHDYS